MHTTPIMPSAPRLNLDAPLTTIQVDWVRMTVARWLYIKAAYEDHEKIPQRFLAERRMLTELTRQYGHDAAHSDLLLRLLEGREPSPESTKSTPSAPLEPSDSV